MPAGSNTSRVMDLAKGSAAAASTTALTRIQPYVEKRYWVPGRNSSGSLLKIGRASSRLAQWRAGILS
jgi:hypothetical protein